MLPEEYINQFQKITAEMLELTRAKNADYAGKTDAFSNFRVVETIGLCSAEVGILTRLSDKLARVSRLLSAEARVAESVEDTLKDLAIYSIILMIYLRSKDTTTKMTWMASPADIAALRRAGTLDLDEAAERLAR